MNQNNPHFLILLAAASVLSGCAGVSPLLVPARPAPVHPLPPLPPAQLSVPIVVVLPPLSEMEKQLGDVLKNSAKEMLHLEAPDLAGNTTNAGKKNAEQFNEKLKKASNIEDKVKEVWKEIQEPVRLTDDVWLRIFPSHISIGDYELIPDPKQPKLKTLLELTAVPKVFFGAKPNDRKVDLPPLEKFVPGGKGFHIEMDLNLKFDEVNKLLMDPKFGIVNMALPGGEDYDVHLRHIRIYGSGEKIVVEAKVTYAPLVKLDAKPAEMTVYLLGTPVYHEKKQTIDFPDMDFDIKSSDFLVQMVDFLDGDSMRDELRKHAVIPVGADLDKLKTQLNKMLNRRLGSHVVLNTAIGNMKMKEAFVSSNGLAGRVAIDGEVAVDLIW